MTPHLNRLDETVQMRGHNIQKLSLVITKYSRLSRAILLQTQLICLPLSYCKVLYPWLTYVFACQASVYCSGPAIGSKFFSDEIKRLKLSNTVYCIEASKMTYTTELQVRGSIEENSKMIFLPSPRNHIL